jgi:hypothetical protein
MNRDPHACNEHAHLPKETAMTSPDKKPADKKEDVRDDDTSRDEQKSHGSEQHRTKKDGHTTGIGSGHDKQTPPHPPGGR